MKKRRVFAILMAVFFIGITLTVFAVNDGSGDTTAAGPGGDITTITASDVNGVFVPE